MTAGKQTRSLGAAATDKADSKLAGESNGAEEKKPSTSSRSGKKGKGKLVVKSSGAKKPKEAPGPAPLFIFQHDFHKDFLKKNPNDPNDKASIDAVYKDAADRWESMSDSDKAPYVARAHVNKILHNQVLARVANFQKTLKLADKMVKMKM